MNKPGVLDTGQRQPLEVSPTQQVSEFDGEGSTLESHTRVSVPLHMMESDNSLANELSNSLADVAHRNRPYHHLKSMEADESSDSRDSLKGEQITRLLNSPMKSSGSSDDAATGDSAHIVTATASAQTGTTSSGDDRDSSGGTASFGEPNSNGEESREQPKRHQSSRQHSRHHEPHLHRSIQIQTSPGIGPIHHQNDGSALLVAGSDRLAGGPATVVASLLPPRSSDTNNSSSGSGGEGDAHDGLLQPRREPGYHTIRKTFSRLPSRRYTPNGIEASMKHASTNTLSSDEGKATKSQKVKRLLRAEAAFLDESPQAKKRRKNLARMDDPVLAIKDRTLTSPSPESVNSNEMNGEGSSGSGTEGGYMGSADSKENESSSSPSVSSSEIWRRQRRHKRRRNISKEPRLPRKHLEEDDSGDSSSSEIADFSSGSTSEGGQDGGFTINAFQSASPSLSSNDEGSSEDGYEEAYLHTKKKVVAEPTQGSGQLLQRRRWTRPRLAPAHAMEVVHGTPILAVGSDIMAHVLTFLQPPEILDVLTMPLSRDWRRNFTSQPELWRVLCLVEPFKADIDDEESDFSDGGSSEDSYALLELGTDGTNRKLLDRYRLLYTSFVRCMKYLAQIRDDAISGKQPSYIDYGNPKTSSEEEHTASRDKSKHRIKVPVAAAMVPKDLEREVLVSKEIPHYHVLEKEDKTRSSKKRSRPRPEVSSISTITDRLLGPSASGDPGNLDLPWSCAIYSIVNWMVRYDDVEGIQTLCMKVLPFLLENEQQRQTAQRAGLTNVVLRAMVCFPDSVQLHIAAFHTIVLLARPLGGREGMLFHSSMILTGIFDVQTDEEPKSGIAVMVESMNRFEDNAILQAMSCWALVNVALAPSQKRVLVQLGGIEATTNAMIQHPYSAEVQFRALFALINLVIPSVRLNSDAQESIQPSLESSDENERSEKNIIDDLVGRIATLVVQAMKNFCSSEAILNRACLVLHNLSLTTEYHSTILWTPDCYQMLEWCIRNYPSDQVLQQSAGGTLHRLQVSLSRDEDLQARFRAELRSQHQTSLQKAHQEAVLIHRRHLELELARRAQLQDQEMS